MSPARSRSSALAAFVGSKGNADSKAKTTSQAKAKKNSKQSSSEAVVPDKVENEIVAKSVKGGKSTGKACAPFRPANGNDRETLWEAQDTAVAVAVSLTIAPSGPAPAPARVRETKPTSAPPHPPPGLPAKAVKAQASKENSEKEREDLMEKETLDVDLGLSARDRDVRAYEHERQRVKKAEERAARMARKEREGATRGVPSVGAGGGGRGTKSWEMDGEYVVHSAAKAQKRSGEEVQAVAAGGNMKHIGNEEILLSDLVVYKGRAGRGKGGEEEFELVPAVRAVIVLDEGEFGSGKRDMEVDDWECVDVGVKEGGASLSYAQVVLGLHID